ncbi:hypothetical protein Taro_027688 [Colocasia esculenta]|uniref:Uncharacterized protein n=1 Tax=Colocasia esculenta TaxID=4460 RepID=A0A843VKU6_COLES|nr:hypothetical protein [Colocasia esculenta]
MNLTESGVDVKNCWCKLTAIDVDVNLPGLYWKLKNLMSTSVDVKFFRVELDGKIPCLRLEVCPSKLSSLFRGLRFQHAVSALSLDVECDTVQCVPLMVVTSQFSWGPFSTPARFQFLSALLRGVAYYATDFCGSSSAPGAEEPGRSDAAPA